MNSLLVVLRTVSVWLLAWVAMGIALPVSAQISLSPAPVPCLVADGNTPVLLQVQPAQGLSTVRVYFRAVNEPEQFFFLEMRFQDNGFYWAVLPIPESSTREVQLYFAVTDDNTRPTATSPVVVPVTSNCPVSLSNEQAAFARNLVVGETDVIQKDELVWGFQCPGIVSRLDTRGELRPDDKCREALFAWTRDDVLIPALLVGGAVGGAVYLDRRDRKDASPSRP